MSLFAPGAQPRRETPARGERDPAFVELTKYRHRVAGESPVGAQKVIGFARSLALEPRVLLLGEPSAGLPREEREDLARFTMRIKHDLGIGMIWVEHDMQMVADLADRLYVIAFGQFLAEGRPAEVLAELAAVEAYLGKPQAAR